jgi:hypothetical protein
MKISLPQLPRRERHDRLHDIIDVHRIARKIACVRREADENLGEG